MGPTVNAHFRQDRVLTPLLYTSMFLGIGSQNKLLFIERTQAGPKVIERGFM